jgi:hypothetical protein
VVEKESARERLCGRERESAREAVWSRKRELERDCVIGVEVEREFKRERERLCDR